MEIAEIPKFQGCWRWSPAQAPRDPGAGATRSTAEAQGGAADAWPEKRGDLTYPKHDFTVISPKNGDLVLGKIGIFKKCFYPEKMRIESMEIGI